MAFPRGIYYGWWVVTAAFAVMTFGFACAYSFSAFFPELQREFGASRASVSLVFSIGGALYFFMGAVSGPLADRFGPRWVCTGGMVFVGLGLLAASRADSLAVVYLGFGLGVGLGVGFSYVPSVGAVQPWFTVRRGFASGLAVSGIGVGTLIGPMVASALIAGYDWRVAFMVLGLATMVAGGVAALFIENDPARRGSGLVEDAAGPAAAVERASLSLREAVRTRPFWLLFCAAACLSFALFVPFVHLVPYALGHGMSAGTGAVMIGMVGVGSTAGRFLIGGVADRLGRVDVYAACFVGVVFMYFFWLFAVNPWTLGLFGLVFGTCYGGFVALFPSIIVDYFGSRAAGAIIGALYASVGIGTLLGPTFAGYVFDTSGTYDGAILAGELVAVVAAFLAMLLPNARVWRRGQGLAV